MTSLLTPKAGKPFTDVTEKELQSQLFGTKVGIAKIMGWACYHTLKSKGSEPGFPDWTLARDRVIFVELKTEKGRLSEAQIGWVNLLRKADAEVYVVRPRHLEEITEVLRQRRRQFLWPSELTPQYQGLRDELDAVFDMR